MRPTNPTATDMHVQIGHVNQGVLVACDGCGRTAALNIAKGWRVFDPRIQHTPATEPQVGHHCPTCVEHNDLVHHGLVFGADPATAVVYESED